MNGSVPRRPIRCAVIGYGPLHSFGRAHGRWIAAAEGLEWAAVCDRDPARVDAALREFPGLRGYTDVGDLLSHAGVDMVSIVTPHHTHAPLTLACLRAGLHVVVDKAMCLTVAEATGMIDEARSRGRMLAVFHARRQDGNYRAIRRLIRAGEIGDPFHLELAAGGYRRPSDWWYSRKELSGGAFYYWGPHAIDWVLDLVGDRVAGVTGFYHKRVWNEVDIEDQVRAILRFRGGTVADVTFSHIAAAGKPLWRILGTRGAIVDSGRGGNRGYQEEIAAPPGGALTLIRVEGDRLQETTVPYMDSDWTAYYSGIANHLLSGGPVPVTGEDGRRTIAVMEAAERSSRSGRTEEVEYE